MPDSRTPKGWYPSSRRATSSISPGLKQEAETKTNTLIETILKPRYVQPPPEHPQFNYIEEIDVRWHGSTLFFCAQYRVVGPYAIAETFEARFARMKYAGRNLFDLAFMRHTGQWIELHKGLTVDACLDTIRDDAWFQP